MAHAEEMRRIHERHLSDFDSRRDAVLSLRRNAANMVAQLEQAHHELADRMRDRIHELDDARDRMSSEQRQRLTEFHNKLQEDVTNTVRDLEETHRKRGDEIGRTIRDHEASRHKMGRDQEKRLTDEHVRLEATVDQMRDDLREDLTGGQHAWHEHAKQMHHRRKGAHATPAPTAAVKGGSAADDLTTISGLGAGRLQRLHAMGIRTFAQLAQASASEVRHALGPSGNLVNVEAWIEAAKRRL